MRESWGIRGGKGFRKPDHRRGTEGLTGKTIRNDENRGDINNKKVGGEGIMGGLSALSRLFEEMGVVV